MAIELEHPIDQEIRAWLKRHVDNRKELSVAAGHSTSWLQKYVNGEGHATIDDLVRIAGLLFGLNLPVISPIQRELLKACRGLGETDMLDLISMAEGRSKNAEKLGARRGPSKESNEPAAHTPPATTHKAHGKQKGAKG